MNSFGNLHSGVTLFRPCLAALNDIELGQLLVQGLLLPPIVCNLFTKFSDVVLYCYLQLISVYVEKLIQQDTQIDNQLQPQLTPQLTHPRSMDGVEDGSAPAYEPWKGSLYSVNSFIFKKC